MTDLPPRPAAGRSGLSRRAALLLAAGGLAQASVPLLRPAGRPAAVPEAAGPALRPVIEELLAARARALLALDRAVLLAGAAPAAAQAQHAALDRMAQVPFAELGYRITSFTEPPPEADRITVAAEFEHRLVDLDAYPAVLSRRLELVRLPEGWRLAADEPAGAPALWDLGPVRVARGTRCLVLGLAEQAEVSALATRADQAVPAVEALWGDAWPGRLLLELPSTEAEFARLLEVQPEPYRGIAAVTVAVAGAPEHTPADRILVNPEAYRGLSELGRRVVVTHEATHVATRAVTRSWTPMWLSEGVADHTAYLDSGRTARQIAPGLAQEVAAGRIPRTLPSDADFTAGADRIGQAYELSWLACEVIAREFGERSLVRLYQDVGVSGRAAAGESPESVLDRLLRGRLGIGTAEFTALWTAEAARLA
ncbi:hypothetical protein AB0K43_28025 [Kitasatospora sp. NPDC049258]|uniref:hypothetical protein n=1 Tax=Kitasatospora sp. NPDC049258 TaxID=3155394 RepID=UPI00342E3C3E